MTAHGSIPSEEGEFEFYRLLVSCNIPSYIIDRPLVDRYPELFEPSPPSPV